MLSTKLSKGTVAQILSFDILGYLPDEDKPEDGHDHGEDDHVHSLLGIHLVQGKVKPHADLALNAVFWKLSLELLGQWENTIAIGNHCQEENPEKSFEEFEIRLAIMYQSTIRILYKYEPAEKLVRCSVYQEYLTNKFTLRGTEVEGLLDPKQLCWDQNNSYYDS